MKYKNLLFWFVIWGILLVFFQFIYKYHFYHIEQNQLFLFSGSYIADKITSVGGLSRIISEFLLQFFIYPYVGAIITATLLTWIGIQTSAIVRRIDPESNLIILSLLSVVTLAFMHFNFNYFLQGTISYSLMVTAFYFYLKFETVKWKVVFSLFAIFFLFWWAGSVAILFASAVLIREISEKLTKSFWYIPTVLFAIFIAYISIQLNLVGEYRFAFLPDMYYHNWIKPDSIAIYLSWISFPIIIICAYLFRKVKAAKGKTLIVSLIVQLALAVGFFWYGFRQFGDERSLKFKEMEYYSRTEQWDKIIEMNKGSINNYLYSCYLNMALSRKGELADRMFTFDQMGEAGIMVAWNKSHAVSMLQSDVYYAMCHTGASQQMAFEANISSPGQATGRMYQRLVETNLIYGEYAVAEKYISLLEKTFYYKDWASSHRKFLNNDAEVEKDPILGSRRRSLPKENILFPASGLERELANIAISNPQNTAAIQYLGGLYLVVKRLDFFEKMIDTYYKTDVLPVLPISFQEAVITLHEKEPDSWAERGVSPAVASRFVEYKKFILANRNSPALPNVVKNQYGNTYWYYFMDKKQ